MNIANFGFSGGDAMSRPGTGTVPASSGSMFGDMLPFRLEMASLTAKPADAEGATDAVVAAGPAFPGLEGLELSVMPETISIAAPEGELAGRASEEGVETEELAPTLALLAPIVDTTLPTNVVAIGGGEISARAASLASTNVSASTGNMADEAGNDRLMAQLAANTDPAEEVLADPDGDVAAMLRRVRASATERAPAQRIAADTDRTAAGRPTETASADIAPRLDQVQGSATQVLQPAPDLARFRAASTAVANAAAEAETDARSNGDKTVTVSDSGSDQRQVAGSISDLRVGGAVRQANDPVTSRISGSSATERRSTRIEMPDAGRELDFSAIEADTVEDTPFQRQVATSVTDVRAVHTAPFAAQHAAATNADQGSVETGARSEAAQTLPLDQRFSDRLGAMVGAAMGNATLKDGTLRLQVTPDHLGPIEIEMDSSGSSDRLQITVESEAVRQAVAQAHGRIEQELRQAGAKLAGIDVALRDSGADAQDNAQTNAHTNSQADTDGRRPGSTNTHDTASTAPDAAELRSAPRGGDAGNVLYA